jgi:hypothetical protein
MGMVMAAVWFILQLLLYSGMGMDEESIIVLGLLALGLFSTALVVLVRAIRRIRNTKRGPRPR